MGKVVHWEPYELRGSRTVLGARGGEIPPRDSLAAVSPVADARPARCGARSFHTLRLGGTGLLVAGTVARGDAEHGAGLATGVRRRHDAAGARSRSGQDQDRTAVVLRGG